MNRDVLVANEMIKIDSSIYTALLALTLINREAYISGKIGNG